MNGVSDAWEYFYFGANYLLNVAPWRAGDDADGDGFSNETEWLRGSSPLLTDYRLTVVVVPSGAGTGDLQTVSKRQWRTAGLYHQPGN